MNIEELIDLENFKEENFIDYLKSTFNITPNIEETEDISHKYIEKSTRVAEKKVSKFRKVGFFIIKSSTPNIEKIRVGFSEFVANLITKTTYAYSGLMVAIYHPDSKVWRLSYVAIELDDNNELSTNPKRYTFELGDVPAKTALEQLKTLGENSTLQDFKEAFATEKISNKFFQEYKELYYELIALDAVTKEIKGKSNQKLFVKKLLGRIVFLYFLQKKGWLGSKKEWGDGNTKFMKEIFESYKCNDFYADILNPIFFDALNEDRKKEDDYFEPLKCKMPFLNGGLFSPLDFELDSNKKPLAMLENKIFEKIFNMFNSYNFTIIEDTPHDSEVAIDPEMLGRVFEDLLEDRKDKGAFYTPREIVHYMAKKSIENYLDGTPKDKQLERIKNIKTLDPAIGSGAFPMGVLHELLETRVSLGDKTPHATMKREIIENNIYGIDIDESAVEIAKLRFWISIVVDEKVEKGKSPQPLPNLFYKIMVGNSLLDTANGFDLLKERRKGSKAELSRLEALDNLDKLFTEYYSLHDKIKKDGLRLKIEIQFKILFDKGLKEYSKYTKLIGATKKEEEEAKTANLIVDILQDMYKNHYSNKIFFYKLYFKEVMNKGGFDLVIGNPPYLRVQGIDKESSQQYKKVFNSATGSYDLYVLFSEKGLELLSKNGILNYIMPHKWINASFGKGLREIAKDKVSSFISFGAYQVFNASTYTSLVWWQNNKKIKHLNYVELDRNLETNKELENYLFNLNDNDFTKIKNSDLTSANWTFTDKKTYEILERLKEQPLRVKDVFEKIFTGLQTSQDSVYFLLNCVEENNLIKGFSKELKKDILIEKGLTKPLLKGDDVHRYEKISTDKVVIFPYYIEMEDEKEKAILYTEDELEEKFPNGYAYLKECESVLRGREKGRIKNSIDWYKYIYPKNLTLFKNEKLITPYLSLGSQLSYDKDGEFYGNTKCFGFLKYSKIKESYKFYLSILNSKLCWYYIKNTSSVMSGGYFTYTKDSLSLFPLPKIENLEDTKPFETLVDKIIKLKEQKKDTKKLEDEIDKMVYKLYGLNDEEILIIEGSV